jgi:hypothetical protein
MMFRQGDILIVRSEIPDEAKPRPDNIVSRGELTGHAHRVDATVLEAGGETYIRALHPAELTHEEHHTIILPEGSYRVIGQREFDGEEIRRVLD